MKNIFCDFLDCRYKLLLVFFTLIPNFVYGDNSGLRQDHPAELFLETLNACKPDFYRETITQRTNEKNSDLLPILNADVIKKDFCGQNPEYCRRDACIGGDLVVSERHNPSSFQNKLFYKCTLDFSHVSFDKIKEFDFSSSIFQDVSIKLPKRPNNGLLSAAYNSIAGGPFILSPNAKNTCACNVKLITENHPTPISKAKGDDGINNNKVCNPLSAERRFLNKARDLVVDSFRPKPGVH